MSSNDRGSDRGSDSDKGSIIGSSVTGLDKTDALARIYQSLCHGRVTVVLRRVRELMCAPAAARSPQRRKLFLRCGRQAGTNTKVIKLHVGNRLVDSVDARGVTGGSLDTFPRFEIELCAVLAPNADLAESNSGLTTRTGSLSVILVGREEFHMLSNKTMERIKIIGVFGSSQGKNNLSFRSVGARRGLEGLF